MLVFVHIQKTAGRTVRYILRSTYGLHHCEVEPWFAESTGPDFSPHDLKRLRKVYPNLKSIGGHRLVGYVDFHEDGKGLKYFTFIRNPLKLVASYFQYNVQVRGLENLDFEEWVHRKWPQNRQTQMIAGEANASKAIQILKEKNFFVGLTEQFDESMVLLKALMANELNISYRRINVARNNTIAINLLSSESTRQMIVEANQADLALYNYVIEELYPSFQREYGSSLKSDIINYQQTQSNNFNIMNLTLSRMKQYLFYKPLLFLSRKGIKIV